MLFLRKFRLLVFFFILFLFVLTAAFFWWRWATGPVKPQESRSQVFVIQKGEGGKSVAQRLQKQGLINHAGAFRLLTYFSGLERQIQAGDFRLSPAWSARQIAETLTHGTLDVWVTFSEGWRREEYAQRLANFLPNFSPQEFLVLTETKEGYLFPDTYLFPKDANAQQVVAILEKNFNKKITTDLEKMMVDQGLTRQQVLVLASLVEREAKESQDKPIVAGILRKRWQADWPLQVDATLQYAKADQTDWWPPVTAADKKISSAYNTYQNKGLPPGPICNPGLASIKAVLSPQSTDYWFYLTDLQGRMHYAVTADQHAANVARYLR